jgi:cytochrome c oxidase assembly factor CtaG
MAKVAILKSIAPTLLLLAGVCALAVWAARQCDPQSVLVERLTGETEQR